MSFCRFFDDLDKHFWEVDPLGKRFEFGGYFLGNIPSFLESGAERVDLDLGEDGFKGCCSIEQELHVGRILQVLNQWSFCQDRTKHAA